LNSLHNLQRLFTGKRLLIPVALGLAVAIYFFLKDFQPDAFDTIQWGPDTLLWIGLSVLMLFLRLVAYANRLRVLSEEKISWAGSFKLIVLWEFSSAISPGIVGGTAAAFVLIAQEKNLNTGQSTALVLATAYLDVLFYVLAIPILLAFTGLRSLVPESIGILDQDVLITYIGVAYCLFFAWASILYIGLFIRPAFVGKLAVLLFRLPFLKRWKSKAKQWSYEIEIAAKEFKSKPFTFWIQGFGATVFAWTARFALVNFLILGLGNGVAVLSIFAKQLVMWGALMIPLTPGASGMAELLFISFLGDYFSNVSLANTTAVIWRLVSYYPYLIAGVIVFPIWLRERIKIRASRV